MPQQIDIGSPASLLAALSYERVAAMDLPDAELKLTITQTIVPRPEMVIAMVEALPAESDAFWSS